MKTRVVVSEIEVCNALSTLISKNPFKQVEWVENVLKDRNTLDKIQWFGSMKGYETPYMEAGLFMLVSTKVDDFKKSINEVQFFETVEDIESELVTNIMPAHFTWYEFHLFYYKRDEGYVEIPFSVGEYVPFKGCLYHYVEKNGCVPIPDKIYFENNIEPDGLDKGIQNNEFFFEVSDLYEIHYKDLLCDTYNQETEYFFFKDFKNAFKFATEELLEVYLNSKVLPYDKYNRVVLSDRWYRHEIYINEDKLEGMFEETGLSIDILPAELIEECIEIESGIKFGEKERGWDYEDTSDY